MDDLTSNSFGIEEAETMSSMFQLYPNPAHNVVQVKNLGYSGQVSVALSDIRGNQVKEQAMEGLSSQLDVSSLPNSIYLYQIRSPDRVLKRGRVILQ